jgi:hypothetical protein
MIIPQSVTSGLCRAFVEPTSREQTAGGLYSHGSCAGAGILHCGALETGVSPMIDIAAAAHRISEFEAEAPLLRAARARITNN